MNLAAIYHLPKSHMAYAYDQETLHLYLQVGKNDATKVTLIAGDPFDYRLENGVYLWNGRTKPAIKMEKVLSNKYHDFWFVSLKVPTKRQKYAFLIHGLKSTYFYGSRHLQKVTSKTPPDSLYVLFDYFNYPYINDQDLFVAPAWTKNTIWYQIFPERFSRSEKIPGTYLPWGSIEQGITNQQFFGGNIPGIIEKLAYLHDLGITGIYLTPLFKASSSHKYDTIDYLMIDPQFGTNEDFKELVQKCHALGIKVMLDAVFNHCGWFHPWFQDVIKNKKQSPYWDCFYIDDEDFIDFPLDQNQRPIRNPNHRYKFRTFATTPMMPKWNVSHPLVEAYLLKVGTYWVQEYQIDAWRLDVSDEVSHEFWRKFKKTIQAINPEVYIVGENWDNANPWLLGDQFDAVMNYRLAYSLWNFLETPAKIDALEFTYAINTLLFKYPKHVAPHMFNLVDSHDTPRILTRLHNNLGLMKIAYLFIFTFTGSPALFYGDEIGLQGHHDPDCRRCMIWDDSKHNHELLAFFKWLINLRKRALDWQAVTIKWLYAQAKAFAYEKGAYVFVINADQHEHHSPLKGPFIDLVSQNLIKDELPTLLPYSFLALQKTDC
ncbi:MAG: Neopullulanase [Tenericutes bacterium ADurb.BinA124]|nr:MAG: Neopullulanase [Tenericutes bacterium ADurb.BinA124]HNZ50911.1 glycoside hydrolase family 13 protein [Bacilli bacterium]